MRYRVTGETTGVSIASDGERGREADDRSGDARISGFGRHVVFTSAASTLVPGDTNEAWDVFVHDRTTGETTRVSVASGGTEGNGPSQHPSISADGRYVALTALAGEQGGPWHVYVYDRQTGQSERISVGMDGMPGDGGGHSPAISADGRYVITYNGEIYNFRELRRELEGKGRRFRSRSDTEVLLAAISQWDVGKALARVQGMFAFALWDCGERNLVLARDRVGKKPVYYGWCGNTFLFSSELKALHAYPDFDPEVDQNALGLLVRFGWIPSPYSIFKHIRKLPAGTYLQVSPGSGRVQASPRKYWSARDVVERGERHPFSGSFGDAANELEALLLDAVEKRMIADVSLGALLSGGIDSSTIVSLMQSLSSRPVKTFSIGFEDQSYNELEYARIVSKHFNTEHYEFIIKTDAVYLEY